MTEKLNESDVQKLINESENRADETLRDDSIRAALEEVRKAEEENGAQCSPQ